MGCTRCQTANRRELPDRIRSIESSGSKHSFKTQKPNACDQASLVGLWRGRWPGLGRFFCRLCNNAHMRNSRALRIPGEVRIPTACAICPNLETVLVSPARLPRNGTPSRPGTHSTACHKSHQAYWQMPPSHLSYLSTQPTLACEGTSGDCSRRPGSQSKPMGRITVCVPYEHEFDIAVSQEGLVMYSPKPHRLIVEGYRACSLAHVRLRKQQTKRH